MHPAAAWAVLVVASLGVFLGGVELMVVAIALPVDRGRLRRLGRPGARLVDRERVPAGLHRGHAARRPRRRPVGRAPPVRRGPGPLLRRQPGRGPEPLGRARHGPGLADRRRGWCRASAAAPWCRCRWRWPATCSWGARGPPRSAWRERRPTSAWRSGRAYGAWVLLNFSLPLPGVDLASWQWIFFLNVPAGDHHPAADLRRGRRRGDAARAGRIDLFGALLVSVALLSRRRRPDPRRRARLDRSADPGRLRRGGGRPAGLRVRGAAAAHAADRPAPVRATAASPPRTRSAC